MRELVLDDPAPFIPLVLTKRNRPVEYEARSVILAGRRYIVDYGKPIAVIAPLAPPPAK